MKLQKSDHDKKEFLPVRQFKISLRGIPSILIILLAVGYIFTSCENDIEKINTITSIDQFPDASGKKYEILYSDSFRVQVRILTPEIERFARIEEPYIKFPKGMTAYFYDDSMKIEAYIKAKDVIYFEKEAIWEAKNNVEARNLANGNQINTEHMFWDEQKDLIYSYTQSRIVNENGTFYGENGFEARQDLSWYRLWESKGIVTVKNE
ncbi:LPS export ABC transporter periplasmic protein LptC [Bacteroidota bacterium]